MINYKYQVIIIGNKIPYKKRILESLFERVAELGVSDNKIEIIDSKNFRKKYKANQPAFCLYYGENPDSHLHIKHLDTLLNDAIYILPVVKDLNNFSEVIPDKIRDLNGFLLSSTTEIQHLVNTILEGLGLLRLTRRLFISYKRKESRTIAIQLYEEFEQKGFDVFLDTHSIRKGDPFQDELWHRMADTDVVVLLNTPNFLKSKWTTEELAKANAMSIGILQIIWPNHNLERDAKLSLPLKLKKRDFGNDKYNKSKDYLTDQILDEIASYTESLRARSLASRQDNIITEFISSAKLLGKKFNLHPEKFITIDNKTGNKYIIIPTVGVPEAFTYNQSQELVSQITEKEIEKAFILYDHRHLREKWIEHLGWLDDHLPIKSIKIVEVEKWLKKI